MSDDQWKQTTQRFLEQKFPDWTAAITGSQVTLVKGTGKSAAYFSVPVPSKDVGLRALGQALELILGKRCSACGQELAED